MKFPLAKTRFFSLLIFMETIGIILLILSLIVGIAIIFFGVAGTFIIAAGALVYGLATSFEQISVQTVVILFGVAVALEVLEAVLGGILAKRFGGSNWAMVGAVAGGIAGAVLGTPAAPVIGTLLGGFIGAWAGAFALELLVTGDSRRSMRAGTGALIGAVSSKLTKLIVALVMSVAVIIQVV